MGAPPTFEVSLDSRSDDDLVAALDSGPVDEAMAALQGKYHASILRFARGFVQDEHLAQDVTQEAFERVFTRSHRYRPGTCFRAWLFEIARNQALSALRARRRIPRPFSSYSGPDDAEPFEHRLGDDDNRLVEEREMMQAFRRAVARLPKRYGTAFRLCALEGREYAEAARLLGVPTGTVAIRVMRARRRLFESLSRHLGRLRRPPACAQGLC